MDRIKVQRVIYNAIGMLKSSIDVLARMLTGDVGSYASDGARGAPGQRSWDTDRARRAKDSAAL